MSDHVPDPLPLPPYQTIDMRIEQPPNPNSWGVAEAVVVIPPDDPPGLCQRCHKQCRDFTEVGGRSYCDSCAEMVRDIRLLFNDLKEAGTGQP